MIIAGRLLLNPSLEPQPGWVRVANGRIAEVREGTPPYEAEGPIIGGAERIISPAFTDAHMHIPQIDAVGCDGMPLLEWLDRVVFPAEQWWADGGAAGVAKIASRRLVREGTAGIAAFLTSHAQGSFEAARWLAQNSRLRMHLGRVAMDRNAPAGLTAEDCDRAAMQPAPSPLLSPYSNDPVRHRVSANPRFAVSCSEELLAEVAWAVRESGGEPSKRPYVHTHLSESHDEIRAVRELFPDDPHYTAVYDRLGLLGPRTLLAHCVHLSEDEWQLLAERECIAVHCPTANTFLQSGVFDLDAAERHGVRIALGSDVAGGPDVAMPRVARAMIETAKHRRMVASDPGAVRVPSPAEAWDWITRRNAELLDWPLAGTLEVGAPADILVLAVPVSWHDEHLIGRLIYNWRSGLIEHRVLAGEKVAPGESA